MPKILVVDDRAPNRDVIGKLLQDRGHTVLQSSNGEEALERVRAEHPDLVVAEIVMPSMDGYEFVRRLRNDPEVNETPVVFYTATHLEKEAENLARACGVSQVICKPFEPRTVLDVVEETLRGQGLTAACFPLPTIESFLQQHIQVLGDQLCQRARELEELQNNFEKNIAERTAELEAANRKLKEQISERRNSVEALRAAIKDLASRAKQLEETTADMKLLTEMGELLQACVNLEEARSITQQFTQKLFPLDAGAVYLAREFGDSVEVFASWGQDEAKAKRVFRPDECWALRRGRLYVVREASAGTTCAHLEGAKPGGFICVPLMAQGQALGVLHISWNGSCAAQDSLRVESRRRLAMATADNMALALANVRLRENLKEQTIRDPLTRLYNRRYLEDSLDREVSRARRAGTPIGIIMIDVDNFKHFNDSFGHRTGDELLRALGHYLRSRVRPGDIASRYGGEEFTLILPGTPLDIIRKRAEALRKGVRGIQLASGPPSAGFQASITLSLGVALFPNHGTSGEGVLRAADEALYKAKMSGRDCVVVADKSKKVEMN